MQLDDRERALEDKFAHDEELHFKIRARRNKLAGIWAADKLRKLGDDATKYADYLVTKLLSKEQLQDQLKKDFAAAGISVEESEIIKKVEDLVTESRQYFYQQLN